MSLWLTLASFSLFVPHADALPRQVKSATNICAIRLHSALNGETRNKVEVARTLDEYYEAQMRMSAHLQVEWTRLNNEGLKPGEHFLSLRENGIKDVNTLAGIALTERYLLLKAWHITRILEANPRLGRLVHRNFKDTVIVTKLKPEEFKAIVIRQLREALDHDMRSYGARGLSYVNLLMTNTSYGVSRSFEGAHLKSNGHDINTWHKETVDLRQEIDVLWKSQSDRHEANSTEFLISVYRARRKSKTVFNVFEIEKELRAMGIQGRDIRKMARSIERYFDLIQGADMLPPPDAIPHGDLVQLEAWLKSGKESTPKIQQLISRRPWTQRHALFLKSAYESGAKFIFALDIKGFGVESFAVRDRFIVDPNMQRQDLRKIYEASTRWLDSFFDHLVADIKAETGVTIIAKFRSGDDVLLALHPSTTPQQAKKVSKYIREKRKDVHFAYASKESSNDSLSLIIDKARVGLNQYKEAQEAADSNRN